MDAASRFDRACAILTAVEGAATPSPSPQTFQAVVRDRLAPPSNPPAGAGSAHPTETPTTSAAAHSASGERTARRSGSVAAGGHGELVTDENRAGGDATGAAEQDTTTTAAGSAAPRRRRRATAPAGAPDGRTAEQAAEAAAQPTADAPAPGATDAPAPTRRRSTATKSATTKTGTTKTGTTKAPGATTRTRRAKAADAAEVAAETSAEAPAADGTAEARASEAPEAKAAPARRRRATAKAAPAADAAPAEAQADDAGAPDAPADEAPAEPTRRTTRSRGGSRTRRAADAPAADAAPAEAPAEEPQAGERAPEVSTASDVRGTPRLATTAVLFQEPQPSAARRRRAEAPAGPPRPADEAEATEEELEAAAAEEAAAEEQTVAEDGTGAEETTGETTEAAEEGADDAEQAQEGEGAGEREGTTRRRRRRGGRGRRGRSGERAEGERAEQEQGEESPENGEAREGDAEAASAEPADGEEGGEPAETDETGETGDGEGTSSSRRRRRRRRSRGESADDGTRPRARSDEVTALKGSTRLEAKRQRRREGRDAGRRRTVITEAEFLARRESVERTMVVREANGRVQIAILEDGVLVEHYVSRSTQASGAPMAGNVYLGRVQNVLPSMEAAFVDIGKGRNAVLYAGEVNWDAAGLEGQPRRIEQALKSGDSVLVQVTKEPVGHKGARLTSQITLAGRYLVYVPGGGMTGISRKLPENERARLKKILREIVPDDAGVIVRTAAEGASDEELRRDVQRLQDQWAAIQRKATTASAPALLQGEPDLAIRVVRDVFNDDFAGLVVQGEDAWATISDYVGAMAPDLVGKLRRWDGEGDVFAAHRVEEQLAKAMDRKVWLPSGGSLVIDRTEAMTVIDVNTGKFTGSGGTLEETVTRNNLEAAEEIVRQLRLRDIGGIIVIDFIDMVLESNRDLVLRRLVECLGRDRTKHQVAEVTSLGLVQMTRKRVGQGLLEAFSETCPHCGGRGYLIHNEPVSRSGDAAPAAEPEPKKSRRKRGGAAGGAAAGAAAGVQVASVPVLPEAREAVKATLATIAAAAAHAHEKDAHTGEDAAASGEQAAGDAEGVEATAAPGGPGEPAAEQPSRAPLVELPEPAGESPAPVSSGVPDVDLLDAIASIGASEAPAADDEPPAPTDS
jgi:ribonuclease E